MPALLNTLYSKLAVVLTGLFLLVGLLFVGLTLFSTDMYQQEVTQQLNRDLAHHIVSKNFLIQGEQVNEDALKKIFDALMIINPGIEIYLLDPEGTILSFSAPPGKVKLKKVDLEPIKNSMVRDAKLPLWGDDPRNPDVKKVFSAAPISSEGRLQGYLYVILGGELYDSIAQRVQGSFIMKVSAWMIFAGVIFALITGLILFALLTGRLKRLDGAVDAFQKDGSLQSIDLPIERKEATADEIDRLGATFTQMAARIEDQLDQLRNTDMQRRELIAGISHDLRTPLATLRGYMETLLLKNDRLSGDERRSYLEIAIRHCERLSRLVGQLLELAKFESCQIHLTREPVNLGELVHDVVQKFRLTAEEKGIDIEITGETALPQVDADISLIERVLENLIENAIHFTPSGGTVCLDLGPEEEDVVVRVIDTGKGISPEVLPSIFERFYQSDRDNGNPSDHSGLGLAIARRILELHGKDIQVTSTKGIGTTFIFRLPIQSSV